MHLDQNTWPGSRRPAQVRHFVFRPHHLCGEPCGFCFVAQVCDRFLHFSPSHNIVFEGLGYGPLAKQPCSADNDTSITRELKRFVCWGVGTGLWRGGVPSCAAKRLHKLGCTTAFRFLCIFQIRCWGIVCPISEPLPQSHNLMSSCWMNCHCPAFFINDPHAFPTHP